jgi:hypothetical protein
MAFQGWLEMSIIKKYCCFGIFDQDERFRALFMTPRLASNHFGVSNQNSIKDDHLIPFYISYNTTVFKYTRALHKKG